MIDYKKELNESQLRAVEALKGPQLVIAGAGSGKTRTLVYKVAYLIEHGVRPENILLLTFTRKAANEMMSRAFSILDKRCFQINGGTFHSVGNLLLRKYASQIGYDSHYTILDQGDAQDVINLIRSNFTSKTKTLPKKDTILAMISKSINTNQTIKSVIYDEYPKFMNEIENIESIGKQYKQYKKEKSLMDYDDLLVNLKELLEHHPDLRKKLSATYRYIMLDEFQDTNRLQAQIAYYFASTHGNIMVVGDDSQSIYSFRGAQFRNIMDFPKVFKNAEIIKLEQNYRSTQPILNFTNQIISHFKEKYSKKLFSDIKGSRKPQYLKVDDSLEQAAFVCDKIEELREKNVDLSNMSVLFRAGWHSNELEVELNNRQIPYVKYGGLKFTETAHVKDVLSFLRVHYNFRDEIAWLRLLLMIENVGIKTAKGIAELIMTQKREGMSYKALYSTQTRKKYSNQLDKLFHLIDQLDLNGGSPSQKMELVIGYYKPILEMLYDDSGRRINDLDSLSEIALKYKDLEEMLGSLTLDPPQSSKTIQQDDQPEDCLVLSTIHSSKGLEWDSVFVIDLVDGRFPSMKSFKKEAELEEERRLFYVAATRAKKRLFMLTPNISPFKGRFYYDSHFDFDFNNPSKFIAEIVDLELYTEIIEDEFSTSGRSYDDDAYFSDITDYFKD